MKDNNYGSLKNVYVKRWQHRNYVRKNESLMDIINKCFPLTIIMAGEITIIDSLS